MIRRTCTCCACTCSFGPGSNCRQSNRCMDQQCLSPEKKGRSCGSCIYPGSSMTHTRHTCTHTHTHVHTHTHTHTRTYIHTHTHTHSHSHIHMYTLTHAHTQGSGFLIMSPSWITDCAYYLTPHTWVKEKHAQTTHTGTSTEENANSKRDL